MIFSGSQVQGLSLPPPLLSLGPTVAGGSGSSRGGAAGVGSGLLLHHLHSLLKPWLPPVSQ